MSLLEAFPDLRADFVALFSSCGWTVSGGSDRAAIQQGGTTPVDRLLAAHCPLCGRKTAYAAPARTATATATRAGVIRVEPPARRALAELGLPAAIKPLARK